MQDFFTMLYANRSQKRLSFSTNTEIKKMFQEAEIN